MHVCKAQLWILNMWVWNLKIFIFVLKIEGILWTNKNLQPYYVPRDRSKQNLSFIKFLVWCFSYNFFLDVIASPVTSVVCENLGKLSKKTSAWRLEVAKQRTLNKRLKNAWYRTLKLINALERSDWISREALDALTRLKTLDIER